MSMEREYQQRIRRQLEQRLRQRIEELTRMIEEERRRIAEKETRLNQLIEMLRSIPIRVPTTDAERAARAAEALRISREYNRLVGEIMTEKNRVWEWEYQLQYLMRRLSELQMQGM